LGTKTIYVVPTPNTSAIAWVALSGSIGVGGVITATAEDASGAIVTDATFKWKRANDENGTGAVDIPGATSATYTLTETDAGKYIAAEVDNIATADPGVLSSWVKIYSRPYDLVITGIPAAVAAQADMVAVFLFPAGTPLTEATEDSMVAMPGSNLTISGSGPYTVAAPLWAVEVSVDEEGKTHTTRSDGFRTNGTYDVWLYVASGKYKDEEGDTRYTTYAYYKKAGVPVNGEITAIAFSGFTDITDEIREIVGSGD